MNTSTPANTPGSPENQPRAVATESNVDIDSMLNQSGFATFLESYADAESFEVTEENKDEIAKRFRAFEASKTLARQFETAMNQKLQAEGKGRITIAERQAYRDYVTELAAHNPDKLADLQDDLRALEEDPEKIRAKEAELLRLKESWSADKVKAGIAELSAKKAEIEKVRREADAAIDATTFSNWQNFLGRFGRGKQGQYAEQRIKWTAELEGIDAKIKEAEDLQTSSHATLMEIERAQKEAVASLGSAQEEIFASNKIAQMVRERLISETNARLEQALQSTDIGTLQKAAEQFAADKKLAETGSDYLGPANAPKFSEEYEKALNEQIKAAIFAGIFKALESVPSGSTLSRVERALKKFTELAGKEVGFMDKDETRDFVRDALVTAEREALQKKKGHGQSVLLKRLITNLSKAGSS